MSPPTATLPPPPPPPPPPPMPDFDRPDRSFIHESALAIDLLSPSADIKPHMKMRTFNWRRIPKRRILSQHIESGHLTLDESFSGMKITKSGEPDDKHRDENDALTTTSDSSDDEATNIWFKIAKANKTIRRVERATPSSVASSESKHQIDTSQETITNSDNKRPVANSSCSQPISSASSKPAQRIREMLESVRRRMAAVTECNGNNSKTPIGNSNLFKSTFSLCDTSLNATATTNSKQPGDSCGKKPLLVSPHKPKSVIEAIDFHDLESLFCLNNQPYLDDGENYSPNFMRRASWRTNASSDSVISSASNSCDGHFDYHCHLDSSGQPTGFCGNPCDPHNCTYNEDNADDQADSFELLSENILDSKKSLNVNIFLKQLKNQSELIDHINKNNDKLIGEERLQSIMKLLPDESEQVQLMKFYSRNKHHRLPLAEKFLLQLLTRVPNLRLKIKFMLLKEKYYNDIDEQIPGELDKINDAIRELRKSHKFREILNLVLVTGNFLNSGGYAADAVGFNLECLNRLNEVRSNREGVYLIHYVAEVAQKMQLVDFQRDELGSLESASRVCLETIKLDLASMTERINELKCDIDNGAELGAVSSSSSSSSNGTSLSGQSVPARDGPDHGRAGREKLAASGTQAPTIKTSTSAGESDEFLANLLRTVEDIKCNVENLKKRITINLEAKRKQLADYLCEDRTTFNLHECFNSILTFSQRLKVATEENERRLRVAAARQNKSSLKRSNTINLRLPKTQTTGSMNGRRQLNSGGGGERKSLGGGVTQQQLASQLEPAYLDKTRASFGGYISSERRQSFTTKQPHADSIPSRSMAPPNLVRTSSTCSSMVKSSLSSLSSQAASSISNTSDYDDLHEGLMRLLNDSNVRRCSGPQRRASGRIIGQ